MENENDSELRGFINNLVSALGGQDVGHSKYTLGVEALECLRDLKKWLVYYDDRLCRWDVARIIADSTLVTRDIVEILSYWERHKARKKTTEREDRIALLCVELLVPLTWPLQSELGNDDASINQLAHGAQLCQVHKKYKRALLTHPSHSVLRAVLRIALGSMKKTKEDRTPRDVGTIDLTLLLLRNLLAIESEDNTEDDIGRSATIAEFDRQKVLDFIVTMGSSFREHDVLLLEVLYYLLRNVHALQLYGEAEELKVHKLNGMLELEKKMRAARFPSSRHSRFGTMISLKVDTGNALTISGQRALAGVNETLLRLDDSKRWHKPRRAAKKGETERWNITENVAGTAATGLRSFAEKFVVAAFDPFFKNLRSLVERDNEKMGPQNCLHFLYCIKWFLQVERNRGPDYAVVGAVLSHRAYLSILGLIYKGSTTAEFESQDLVHAGILCFLEILIMIRSMGESSNEEWRDAADSMKAQLFYDEIWLDMFATLARQGAKHSLAYACDVVNFTHELLRMLEQFSKQHTYVFVKSKRARTKKLKGASRRMSDEDEELEEPDREAARVTRERVFEFHKYELKYLTDSTLDVYVKVLSNWAEVSTKTLKHVFMFLYRMFVKRKERVLFYSLGLIQALVSVTGKHGIRDEELRLNAIRFLTFYTRRLIQSLEAMPSLAVEILFEKLPSERTNHQTVRRHDKTAVSEDLEFKDSSMSTDEKVPIIVAALLEKDKREQAIAAKECLLDMAQKRADAPESLLVIPPESELLKSLDREPLLRLLLQTAGYVLTAEQVILPREVTAGELLLVSDLVGKGLADGPGSTKIMHYFIGCDEENIVEDNEDDDDALPEEDQFEKLRKRIADKPTNSKVNKKHKPAKRRHTKAGPPPSETLQPLQPRDITAERKLRAREAMVDSDSN